MDKIRKILIKIRKNPKNVRFKDLCKVCDYYFGSPRQRGSSHRIYKTSWPGDPRINIQNKNEKSKVYQVKQVLKAIDKLEDEDDKSR
ncbi:MAG: toxin HicA [Elusimicrobiota bacterium]